MKQNEAIKEFCINFNKNGILEAKYVLYSYGKGIDKDGNIEDFNSYKKIITTFNGNLSSHKVDIIDLSVNEDIDEAKVCLLTNELNHLFNALTQVGEWQYQELLLDALDDWIEEGYKILEKYVE